MDPNDLKWHNLSNSTRKQLEMNEEEFDENVVASSLAMEIIRRLSSSEDTGAQQEPSKNQQSPIGSQQNSDNNELPSTKGLKISADTQISTIENPQCSVIQQQKAALTQKKSPMNQSSSEEVISNFTYVLYIKVSKWD
ncbi:unnamed protein product [Anisakis simplex]|uniref:Uncharacterized protein n=1 Tax=Anisakis simplex TaxID=6269 RepID=A0A0M3JH59_ANISI|nr:unnamed protein product [Anisakis simplex]